MATRSNRIGRGGAGGRPAGEGEGRVHERLIRGFPLSAGNVP